QLYATLLLQIFFFASNLYGWYAWSRVQSGDHGRLQIRWLPRRKAILWLLFCIVGITLMTFNIDKVFNQLTRIAIMVMQKGGFDVAYPQLEPDAFPFWDSCMMIFSIVAMLLMTRKYVENWLLWVVINLISIVIFTLQGVYFMALEYLILTFIAANGTVRWIKSAQERGSRPLMP
ncbi:MAG: nicotinamide riboside transporter PnuC, partial [Enterobacteriaceae bacterium]